MKQASGFLTPALRVVLLLDLRSIPVYRSLFLHYLIAFCWLSLTTERRRLVSSTLSGKVFHMTTLSRLLFWILHH
jgi:hypothetical protein